VLVLPSFVDFAHHLSIPDTAEQNKITFRKLDPIHSSLQKKERGITQSAVSVRPDSVRGQYTNLESRLESTFEDREARQSKKENLNPYNQTKPTG
jgi:hypothetical protein